MGACLSAPAPAGSLPPKKEDSLLLGEQQQPALRRCRCRRLYVVSFVIVALALTLGLYFGLRTPSCPIGPGPSLGGAGAGPERNIPLQSGACSVIVAYGTDLGSNASAVNRADAYLIRDQVPAGCQVILYDKSPSKCSDAPPDFDCIVRPNVGREFETYLNHIVQNYDNLTERLYFIDGTINDRNRLYYWQQMLNDTIYTRYSDPYGFMCIGIEVESCMGFDASYMNEAEGGWATTVNYALTTYGTTPQPPPPYGPTLGAFLRHYVEPYSPGMCDNLCHAQWCHIGVFTTTREYIQSRPVAMYAGLQSTLNASLWGEAGFYMEWAVEPVFGYPAMMAGPAPGDALALQQQTGGPNGTCPLNARC